MTFRAPAAARSLEGGRAGAGGEFASFGLAATSGALYWAATAAATVRSLAILPLLAFVCWVPLLVAVERRRVSPFVLGWIHGLTAIAAGFWLFGTIHSFFEESWLATIAVGLLFFAYHALRPAILCALYARARARRWPGALAFPVLHAACELLFPTFFPWRAAAQVASCPPLMQAAAWGGPVLVGGWLALTNALAARVLLEPDLRRRAAGLVAAAAIPVVAAAVGALSIHAVDRALAAAPGARIALVQPDAPHTGRGRWRGLAGSRALTESVSRGGPIDLVVWPETVASAELDERSLEEWWRTTAWPPQEPPLDAAVLAGAVVRHAPSRGGRTNSALLFRDGALVGEYDKRQRLPFGEYVPLEREFPWLVGWIRGAGHLAVGASPTTVRLGGHTLAPLICYEDMGAGPSAAPVRERGAELLVTLTDDAWFGGAMASNLHLALAKYRAVEHRRYLARAGNQAGTAVIDPAGRVVGALEAETAGTLVREVRWLQLGSFYDAVGDLPWESAIGALAAVLVLVRASRPRPAGGLRPASAA